MEFPNAWRGKISVPPVVGVRIFSGTTQCNKRGPPIPGAPLTYFTDGRSKGIFWSELFWSKGIFWGSIKSAGIFLVREKYMGIFVGRLVYFSSAQINNSISTIYC